MGSYRYSLDHSSRKHLCPECNKHKFVRYIDTETKEYLPAKYGRCDREINCAYHLNPYSDGYNDEAADSNALNAKATPHIIPKTHDQPKPVTFIPKEVLKKTRQGWEQNTFLQNLLNNIPYPFPPGEIEKVIVQYQLGTIIRGYMSGAITFPFIDESNNIRAIQAKKFDKSNHTTTTSFLHSILEQNLKDSGRQIPEWLKSYKENDSKVTCLFGAHLLPKYPKNPVALVEAPKSAIIGTLYYGFPDKSDRLLWVAVYNLSSLSLEKCRALKGRTIVLFPDLSEEGTAFQLWSEKAKTMEKQLPGTRFIVNTLLEQKAGIKAKLKGYDLSDYLIQFDYLAFRNSLPIQTVTEPFPTSSNPLIPTLSHYQINTFSNPQISTSSNPLIPTLSHYQINTFSNLQIPPSSNPKISTSSNPLIPTLSHYQINTFSNLQISTFSNPFNEQSPSENKNWDLATLQSFFSSTQLPDPPIRLNQCTTIHNLSGFISGHLAILNTYNGNPVFLPYLHRIQLLHQIINDYQMTTNDHE